jgi:hypothetical protein
MFSRERSHVASLTRCHRCTGRPAAYRRPLAVAGWQTPRQPRSRPGAALRRGLVGNAAVRCVDRPPPNFSARLMRMPPELMPPPCPSAGLPPAEDRAVPRAEVEALAPWRDAIASARPAGRARRATPHAITGGRSGAQAGVHAPVRPGRDLAGLADAADSAVAACVAKAHAPVRPHGDLAGPRDPADSAFAESVPEPHAPVLPQSDPAGGWLGSRNSDKDPMQSLPPGACPGGSSVRLDGGGVDCGPCSGGWLGSQNPDKDPMRSLPPGACPGGRSVRLDGWAGWLSMFPAATHTTWHGSGRFLPVSQPMPAAPRGWPDQACPRALDPRVRP